jgi:hypothetical protein
MTEPQTNSQQPNVYSSSHNEDFPLGEAFFVDHNFYTLHQRQETTNQPYLNRLCGTKP